MTQSKETTTITALANLCNLDERRIQQLAKEGVVHKTGRGSYLLVQSVQGYIKYLQDRSSSTAINHDLNVERARLTFHQANKAEIESHLLKGTVIDAVTVQLELTKMVAEIRSKMIALPVRIAQVAIAAQSLHEIQDACRREIYVALDELADNADKYTRPNALHMVGDEIAAGADGLAME